MAGIHFRVTGDANGYIAATRQAEAATGKMVGSITEEAKKIDSIFKTLATSATAVFTLRQATQFAKQVAQIRGQFQQLEVAFETMLQSKEKADALMAQVVDTAARTPFDLQGVANGAKQLLAYGVASEEVNDTLIRLGDIAAGLSIPLNDLVYLYGTTMTQGRLFTQDLRQFQGRGIPLADELAKQFGVTKDAVGELVTAGKVGFPEVQKAIMNMTSEGGKFANLMEKQSKTITGQISNLQDAVDQMFNEIGKASEGTISSAISMASTLVENYEKVGQIIGGIVTTYGGYKAALIAFNAVKKSTIVLEAADAVAKRASVRSTKEITVATVLFSKAQKALNASMLTNPYVLAAAAVAALGVGIYALVTAKSKEEKAFERVNGQLESYQENLEKQKHQLQELFNTMNDSNSTEMQRTLAMEQLRKLYPTILKDLSDEELLKLSVAEATKELVKQEEALYRSGLIKQIADKTAEYEKQVAILKTGSYGGLLGAASSKKQERDVEALRYELELLLQQYNDLETAAKKADFLALPADQKIISLQESNAQLDTEIAELDKKLKELHDKKNQAAAEQPQEFRLGSLSGALYEGGMTEDQILAEIKARQQQKALNDKDIAENQAKVDADNKALSEKQKKANYDRQRAEEKAAEELAKMKQDLNNKIVQADIDSMEEGYAKTLKQLKHNLDLENQAIKQQKKDLMKRKENDALQNWLAGDPENRKAYDFKYAGTFTTEELQYFEDMGKLAQQQYNKGWEEAGEKWEKEADFFKRQFEIDAMAEGSEKEKKQRDLDNEREIHKIELQRDAYIEAAKTAHLLAVEKGKASGAFDETKANQEFEQILAGVKNRQNKESLDADREAMQNYYIEYGTFKQKLLYLEQQYNDRIAKAKSEGEKKSLTAERDKVLDELKKSQDAAYQNIFKDPTKMSLTSVKNAIKLARDEIKKITSKGTLSEDDIENVQRLQEAVDRLQGYAASAPFAGFGDGLDGVVAKLNQIRIIKKKIDDAEKTGDLKAKKAAEDELVANKDVIKKNLAGVGVDAFANGLNQAADAMARIAEISGDPRLQLTADIFNGVGNVISSTAAGAASGGWIGAAVGAATSILDAITNAIVQAAEERAIQEQAYREYENAIRQMQMVANEDNYKTVFGETLWGKLNEQRKQYNVNKPILDMYNQYDFMSEKGIEEKANKYWNAYYATYEAAYYRYGRRDTNISLADLMLDKTRKSMTTIKDFLGDSWKEIFDESGNLNLENLEEARKALELLQQSYGGMDATAVFEEALQAAENMKAAQDELMAAAEDYMGNIGNSLGDAIVNGILKGEDAMESFGDVAGGIIEQIAKDFASSWMIENYLKNFEDEMQNAFLSGDAKEITGVVQSIVAGLPNVLDAAETATKEILDMTKGTDYDLYEKAAESNRTSSAKGTVQASQDSVDEVKGIATNIQSHTFSINEQMISLVSINGQMLQRLTGIENNTNRLSQIEGYLKTIGSDLTDLWDRLRAKL